MTFDDLQDSMKRKQIPEAPGLYWVLLPPSMDVVIADRTCAVEKFYKKGKETVNQRDKAFLEEIWQELEQYGSGKDRVLYIGKAINLRNRLNQYKRVMFNNGTNHSGGVYICQIKDCQLLQIEWIEHHSDAVTAFMSLPQKDRKIIHPSHSIGKIVDSELKAEEHRMIAEYCASHGGLLPFANREG